MGMKTRPRTVALLKVGRGAADSEYALAFRHWLFLFGAHLPRLTFEKAPAEGAFVPETLDAQEMRPGESYLIVEAVGGTFVGAVRDERVLSIGGRLPVPGRLYHLVRMGQA